MVSEGIEAKSESHAAEIESGSRFEFGENWRRFLALLDDDRIAAAETSLRQMLEVDDLRGKRFLDIGSGSGLFSLAARRLGATVFSFDYDPNSVACTKELKRRYFNDDNSWTVEEGSALNKNYVESLGKFDIVYSWGVLHHTGSMWEALENARLPVAENGKLFVAIYNDTGSQARRWLWTKKTYNSLPKSLRTPFAIAVIAPDEAKLLARAVASLKPLDYLRLWTNGKQEGRGMNHWRDIIDWVGGYPYEFATPEEIFDFYKKRGFGLTKLKCGGVGLGCNEFVFAKNNAESTVGTENAK
ncbi:MAG: class I SAM-dependent methyltransferase [Pyrinomonadaceae bacterium]|nr:class I SAM-dependent methyltransferase [Pyrinomonadaceae bacterium]